MIGGLGYNLPTLSNKQVLFSDFVQHKVYMFYDLVVLSLVTSEADSVICTKL